MEKAELFSKRAGLERPNFKDFPGAVSLRRVLNGDKWEWKAKYTDEGWWSETLRLRRKLLIKQQQ